MNLDYTLERPADTAVNIQRDRPTSRVSVGGPRSTSSSPMDSSPPSEMDCAECVCAQNNMDVVSDNAPSPPIQNAPDRTFDFALPASRPACGNSMEALNHTQAFEYENSKEPSPPAVIPYSANVPADPNLWDGDFRSTSLFGTNEFLQSDVRNMACSLQRMASFLRQRNLEDRDGNDIPQLALFGDSAWTFISAIFESGWDKLHTSGKTSFRDNVALQFGKNVNHSLDIRSKNPDSNPIRRVPPPIPPRPTKEQLEKSKNRQAGRIAKDTNRTNPTKSFAQVTALAANILKIKEAFPALPDKKIIEIHNAALNKPTIKGRKIQVTTKGPSRKQAIVPLPDKHTDRIMEDAGAHVHLINNLLKNIKSNLCTEYIRLCTGGISIATNSVPVASDLNTIERYLKSIKGINHDKVSSPHLPQSKSYLKIIGTPYVQPNGCNLSSDDITNIIRQTGLFESISLASKPRVIKASPKSNMAIVWLDIWDSQNRSKAKLLINYSFNYGCNIATIRGTNMNPGIP